MSRLSLELYQGVATLPVEPFCLLRRALICELLYSQTKSVHKRLAQTVIPWYINLCKQILVLGATVYA
jgi:hypothetical protein